METNHSMNGRWKGSYIQGPEYGRAEGVEHSFVFELTEDEEGSFEGRALEQDLHDIFEEPIVIQGFTEDGFISFTKQYPFLFAIDDYGKVLINREKEHPEIAYQGDFDEETGGYRGTFELIARVETEDYGIVELPLTGTWSMVRE